MDDDALRARHAAGQRALYAAVTPATAGGRVLELAGGAVQAAIAPAVPGVSLFNAVVYADGPALLGVRDELAAVYDAAGVRAWTVWVRPGDDAVAAGLRAAGHAHDGRPLLMAADLDAMDLEPRARPRPRPQRPRSPSLADLNDAAYGAPPGTFARGGRAGSTAPGPRAWVARADGRPAAALSLALHDGDAYVWLVATAPEARGRGLASELLRRRAARRARRGGSDDDDARGDRDGRGRLPAPGLPRPRAARDVGAPGACLAARMCFDPDARPPDLPADLALPPLGGGAAAELLELASADGARFSAALASSGRAGGAGVVVLPDIRGLSPFYVELAERFADAGHHAIALDPFGRTAGTGVRGEGFDHRPHVHADPRRAGAGRRRRRAGGARRRTGAASVVVVGFCFGGMQAFLSAREPGIGFDGTVGFYGILAGGRSGAPPVLDHVGELRGPLLGLFGEADRAIPVEQVQAFDRGLAEAGVEHEVVVYPGAPHSFFDRSAAEHAEASQDAWRRVLGFLDQVAGIAR